MAQPWYPGPGSPPFYPHPPPPQPGPVPPFVYQYGPPPPPLPPGQFPPHFLPNGINMMHGLPPISLSPPQLPVSPNLVYQTQQPFPVPRQEQQQQQHLVQDANGWYQRREPSPTSPIADKAKIELKDSTVADFWKGKIGPLPGSTSNPNINPGFFNLPYLTLPTPDSSVPIRPPPPKRKNRRRKRRNKHGTGNGPVNSKSGSATPEDEDGTDSLSLDGSDSDEIPASTFQLDKYADVFIPEYLQAIQRQPHKFRTLEPAAVFPSLSYLSDSLCRASDAQDQNILSAPPDSEQRCPSLSAVSYHQHFLHVLRDELSTVASNKSQIVLWKTPISLADTIGDRAITPHERQIQNNVTCPDAQFVIFVPGIRENHPRLDIGDTVHLREVLVDRQMGSGTAFEARVTVLRKREGLVHLYCPPLQHHVRHYWGPITPNDPIPMAFNITFLPSAGPFVAMDAAVISLDHAMNQVASSTAPQDKAPRTAAHRYLFPDPLDLLLDPAVLLPLPQNETVLWVDSGLNNEQKTAAASVSQYRFPIPYLISGPPGTGKTRTVVESVYQILCVVPNSHILLCAPSNSATDTLALRLAQGGLLKPHEMLRLNDKDRTFAEVPDTIRAFCYVEDDKFALPPFQKLMAYRVVVTSCLDANILVAAQCTNSRLGELEEAVMSYIHPTQGKHKATQPHWTHLLIDEAAQASEPEALIPISVLMTTHTFQATEKTMDNPIDTKFEKNEPWIPQIVLCGDSQQLGPIVASHSARNNELDVSLLERLFDRPVYAEHPLARAKFSWLTGPNNMPQRFGNPAAIRQNKAWVPFVNLVKNYRSHPAILMPPSATFYNDSLEPCAKNGIIRWSGLSNPDLPLVFIGHEGKEECVDERATWFNPTEISRVVEIITSLMFERDRCSPPLQISEIGVIAPWREQVWKLREKLREHKLGAVDVGSVEDYQGRENRVVLISAVRSSRRFIAEDTFKGLGLIFEKKRMNVGITRAKELLIVIGNGQTLKKDPYWRSFLQFALRNNLYVGPPLDIEMDGNYISKLESHYINAQKKADELEAEERGVLFAGGVARDILKDDE